MVPPSKTRMYIGPAWPKDLFARPVSVAGRQVARSLLETAVEESMPRSEAETSSLDRAAWELTLRRWSAVRAFTQLLKMGSPESVSAEAVGSVEKVEQSAAGAAGLALQRVEEAAQAALETSDVGEATPQAGASAALAYQAAVSEFCGAHAPVLSRALTTLNTPAIDEQTLGAAVGQVLEELADEIAGDCDALGAALSAVRSGNAGSVASSAWVTLLPKVELARDLIEPGRFSPAEIAPLVDLLIYHAADLRRLLVESSSAGATAERALSLTGERCELLVAALERDGARLSGKGSSEIERKFLLTRLPPELLDGSQVAEVLSFDQGYLPGTTIRERLRRITAGDGVTYLRTIKAGRGIERLEFEEPMEAALFESLWPLTAGSRVLKRRHVFRYDGLTWEVDEFVDRDLVLAEVELSSVAEEFEIPPILQKVLVRDVTSESGFVNLKLAR